MKRALVLLVVVACVVSATVTKADIYFYNIDTDPAGWAAAVAGMTPTVAYDFDLDPDYSIISFPGPLTSAGAGPVSAGILADGVVMDRDNLGGGPDGLASVGPGSGYGITSNAVLANYFVDAFMISDFPGAPEAFAFHPITLVGGNSIDITVNGSVTFSAPNFSNMGILVTDGTPLLSVRIYDSSAGGAEGVQGLGTLYSPVVPVPPAVILGGLGLGLAGWIQRRRSA